MCCIFFCELKTKKMLFYYTTLGLSLTLLHLYAIYNNGVSEKNYVTTFVFLFSILTFNLVFFSARSLNLKERILSYQYCLNISCFLLVIDLLIRVLKIDGGILNIYSIKKGGLYFDSNFTSLVIVSLCSLWFFIKNYIKKDISLIYYWFLLLMNISTMSRAGILAMILASFCFYKRKNQYLRFSLVMIIGLTPLLYFIYTYFFLEKSLVNLDGSFNSKFHIVSMALSFIENNEFNLLYGVGWGNAVNFIGIFAHNIFVTLGLEFGLLGSILFITIIGIIIKEAKETIYVIFPVFLSGLSLFSAYMPFFFIVSAIIIFEINELRANHEK
jgi:hypothetical protein